MGQMKDFLKKHREQQATAAVAEPKPMVPLVAIVPKDASTTAKALQTAQERTGSEKGKKAPAGQKEAAGSKPGPAKVKGPAQPQKKKQFKPKFRLPDGSLFTAKYFADREKWEGTLTANGVTYDFTASSIHFLFDKLGNLWKHGGKTNKMTDKPVDKSAENPTCTPEQTNL